MDDYSEAPQTITELRSEKEADGSLWTPRDALVSVLRDIDSGIINPDILIISYAASKKENRTQSSYRIASPHFLTAVGLQTRVLHLMCEPS